jgi:ribosomal protein L12E/L44/L45/RPP1/RPP2
MAESSRDDIRKLLKTFGIQADEAVIAHLARNPVMVTN